MKIYRSVMFAVTTFAFGGCSTADLNGAQFTPECNPQE